MLCTRGADTDAAEGTTPLHDAVSNEQYGIAEILLQQGGILLFWWIFFFNTFARAILAADVVIHILLTC